MKRGETWFEQMEKTAGTDEARKEVIRSIELQIEAAVQNFKEDVSTLDDLAFILKRWAKIAGHRAFEAKFKQRDNK